MQAINDFLTDLQSDLQNALAGSQFDKNGNIAKSLRVESNEFGGTLYGWKWIWVRAEFGRAPTSQGATKGNPTLLERITKWVEENNIGKAEKRKSIAYAITKSIHEKGDKLFIERQKKGGTPTGTLLNIINDGRIEELKKSISVEIIKGLMNK